MAADTKVANLKFESGERHSGSITPYTAVNICMKLNLIGGEITEERRVIASFASKEDCDAFIKQKNMVEHLKCCRYEEDK